MMMGTSYVMIAPRCLLSRYNLIRETDTLHNFDFGDYLNITLWITQIASWEIQTVLMKVRNYPHLFHRAILEPKRWGCIYRRKYSDPRNLPKIF